jgi:hypothetical protein
MEVNSQLHTLATFKAVGFEVLAGVVIKHSTFCNITLRSPWSQPTCYACGLLHAGFLHGLFFNHEDNFLQNVG